MMSDLVSFVRRLTRMKTTNELIKNIPKATLDFELMLGLRISHEKKNNNFLTKSKNLHDIFTGEEY